MVLNAWKALLHGRNLSIVQTCVLCYRFFVYSEAHFYALGGRNEEFTPRPQLVRYVSTAEAAMTANAIFDDV